MTTKFRKATWDDFEAIVSIYDHSHDAEEAGLTTTGWIRDIYPVRATAEASLDRDDMYVAEVEGRIAVGGEGAVVVDKVRAGKADFGYNARKDAYENLFEAGVIDPAKVTRVALENAASVAGMFLTTECVIVDHPEEHPAPAMPAGGMGGMM